MALPSTSQRLGGLQDATRVNDLLKQAIDPILAVGLLRGQLIQNIQVTAGSAVTVQHQLNRPYVGYFVARVTNSTAAITVYEPAGAANVGSSITLMPSGTGTISLWIF